MIRHVLQIREPGRPARLVVVTAPTEVGRHCQGVLLDDPAVSRRHLRLDPRADGLVVVDDGSAHGTAVNGQRIAAPTVVHVGDVVTLGATTITVVDPEQAGGVEVAPVAPTAAVGPPPASPEAGRPTGPPRAPGPPPGVQPVAPQPVAVPPAAATPPGAAPPEAAPAPGPGVPMAVRPQVAQLAVREAGHAAVRFLPGTAGERAAAGVLSGARTARRRLAGFGSEPWGQVPQICLVDPLPDPEHPGELLTSGTIVDAARGEIWMVVTPESPPEALERPLAVLFGASLPAAAELEVLIEGYGLFLAGAPDVDDQLRALELPPLARADGELRAAMAVSFVRHVVDTDGEDALRRLLGTARPGRTDDAATDVLGLPLSALERRWRQDLAKGADAVRPGEFVRLSFRYMRPHARRQLEIFAYMLLGLAFTVVYPFASKRLFDTALPSGEYRQVLDVLALLGGAFVITSLANLRRAYLSAYVSGAMVRDIRIEMFGRLQHLSARWYSDHQQGDILSRLFNDVAVVEAGLSRTLRDGLFQVLSLVVSSVVLLTLDLRLGIVVLLGAPLVAVVYRAMANGAQKRSIAVQERTSGLLGVAAENYQAHPVVRVFGLTAREQERFARASDRLFRAERRLNLFGGVFGLAVEVIVTTLRLGVLALGAWLILEGDLTVGGLVAFLGLMGEVINPVTSLTGIGQAIQASSGALVRINAVLDEVPEIGDAAEAHALAPLAHEIRLHQVAFGYTSDRRVLEGVDVAIPFGARVAFVGPSGSGKSTILGLLMRAYDPDEGAVTFDGQDLRGATVDSLRGQLGVVYQDTFLFDTTIRENIALGRPGASDAEVEAAARAAEVHEFILQMPQGYETLVGERGAMLSGGQRQRVAIARALIRNPRVLLLDEATSALDPRTERQIVDTLEKVRAGRTIVAITHRLTSAAGYDLIVVVADGRVVEQGTHEELLERGGVYARLWAEQTGAEPDAPPVDLETALARVPLFHGLGAADLAVVASRLRADRIAAGGTVAEGGGRLLIVARGRARVLVPGLGGAPTATADLGPGDPFGLAALLGAPPRAVLEALEPTTVLVLDDVAISGLAAVFPSVARALTDGSAGATAAPEAGRVLTRTTLGVSATLPPLMPVAAVVGAGPPADPRAPALVPAVSPVLVPPGPPRAGPAPGPPAGPPRGPGAGR